MTAEERRKAVLKIIVEDYIHDAVPLASEAIVRKYDLKVSSATIRNDMVALAEEGYIFRPHASAGSIPTDKAYRFYVETIDTYADLSMPQQDIIQQLEKALEEEIEHWLRQAALLLASLAHNMVIITLPRAKRHHFKHLDIVASQNLLALLILVLYEAKVVQKMIPINTFIAQDNLTQLANKFNALYSGMDSQQILASKEHLTAQEKKISEFIADIMATEDAREYGKPYLEGLCLMLRHPEFFNNPRVPDILQVLEGGEWLKEISFQEFDQREKTSVTIGEENREVALRDLSLLVNQYGIPGKATGLLGVVGPKRMDYANTLSSLRCFSAFLSDTITQRV